MLISFWGCATCRHCPHQHQFLPILTPKRSMYGMFICLHWGGLRCQCLSMQVAIPYMEQRGVNQVHEGPWWMPHAFKRQPFRQRMLDLIFIGWRAQENSEFWGFRINLSFCRLIVYFASARSWYSKTCLAQRKHVHRFGAYKLNLRVTTPNFGTNVNIGVNVQHCYWRGGLSNFNGAKIKIKICSNIKRINSSSS